MEKHQVLVIGAGLAGLSAAKTLKQAGVDYQILEASARPGGKVVSTSDKETEPYFELGGQFVNEDMTEMVSLIQETGMKLESTSMDQKNIHIEGESKEWIDELLEAGEEAIDSENVKNNESLRETLDRVVDSSFQQEVLSSYYSETATVSSEHLNTKALVKVYSLYDSDKNDLTHQASGPLSKVIKYLETLSQGCIQYNSRVIKIEKTEAGYQIETKDGKYYESEQLICAVPPAVANQIVFSGELETHYRPYLLSFINGSVVKVTLEYDQAFWRRFEIGREIQGIQGVIYKNYEGISVSDSSKAGAENRLTIFIGGDWAQRLARFSKEEREKFVMDRLVEVFGEQAADYTTKKESIWVDSLYYGGGYSAQVHTEGIVEAPEKLRESFGNIVFASTELALSFPGFMEGAVRSGQYAAKQLIQ